MKNRITRLLSSQRGLALVVVLWVAGAAVPDRRSFTATTRAEVNVSIKDGHVGIPI